MTDSLQSNLDLEDFTEAGYRRVLELARERYRFVGFGESPDEPHAIWRHDVDASPHRALRLATIEAEEGVRATYCFLLHSPFYNLLEQAVADAVRTIARLGHGVGLHFDSGFYGGRLSEFDLDELVRFEAAVLERVLGKSVEAVSFHNPELHGDLRHDSERIGDFPNAYARGLSEGYEYVSDSNGYWRFKRLADVVEQGHERLHVLTHPEWWVPTPMLPRDRLVRCVEGRAARTLRDYDELLAAAGRRNFG